MTLALRSLVVLLIVLALTEMQIVRTSDRLTVIFLLDQSVSIPQASRQAEISYFNAAIKQQRKDQDRAGAVVFGRDAAIEIPPFDDMVQISGNIEASIDPTATDLSAAMKLAQASFPEDSAKRIVILSDGNQNFGNALEQAKAMAGTGIGIDVVPIRYPLRQEIIVDRVSLPPEIRRGQPFDMRVVVTNTCEPTDQASGEVSGRLILSKTAGDQKSTLSDERVVLPPGKKVFTVRQEIDSPNFYTYEARFVPDRAPHDLAENNRATASTHVKGKSRALFLENGDPEEKRGQFDTLIERLRKQGIEIDVQTTNQTFSTLGELQPYDSIILGNVPREQFSDDQISMLVRNTQQLGAGLVMLGGSNSFGAGGWADTELEKAMPLDFQIKSAKVTANGALVMLFHASEIAEGNFWQKVIGKKAMEALGPQDYCGVLHWGMNGEEWLWRKGLIPIGKGRSQMLAALDRMIPGDMPDFTPGMVMAADAFAKLPKDTAATKHMIVISDGDPSRPGRALLARFKQMNVTISTVAVGAHGPPGHETLLEMADATGGKYHTVNNPRSLPKIFQREARRVSRPLIWEQRPVQPKIQLPHEMLSGVPNPLPPLKGFVQTSKKENPLVEILLTLPDSVAEENNTLLASWTYGLGKTVAFTSDAGSRWTDEWTNLDLYDKLFGQMIRWSMRPIGESGKMTVSADPVDGQIRVVINALDQNNDFLNFLTMTGLAVGPDMKPLSMKIEQTAPGRYLGSFPAKEAGSYFITINTGPRQAPLRLGVTVPYSEEYRELEPNERLLQQLVENVPQGGLEGKWIEAPADSDPLQGLLQTNPFRHDLPKASSNQDAWPYLLLMASCLFFGDVFVRRVQVNLTWLLPILRRVRDKLLGRKEMASQAVMLDRLKSKKAEIGDAISSRRESIRFELPEANKPPDLTVLEEPSSPDKDRPKQPAPGDQSPTKSDESSYTERLLKAKKKVWKKDE